MVAHSPATGNPGMRGALCGCRSEERIRARRSPDLKAAPGTNADQPLFRKLREIRCRSSYSHRGRYFILRTCEALVAQSEAGFATDELEHVLHVGVKDAPRKLAEEGRVFRDEVVGRFVAFASDRAVVR